MVEICTTTAQEQLSEIGAGAISGCFADNVLLGTDHISSLSRWCLVTIFCSDFFPAKNGGKQIFDLT